MDVFVRHNFNPYHCEIIDCTYLFVIFRQSRAPKAMQLRKKRDASLDEFNNQYQPNKDTKIIIHGWRSSSESDTVKNIKDSYLNKFDINVIGQ